MMKTVSLSLLCVKIDSKNNWVVLFVSSSFEASKSMSKGLITMFLKFGILHRPTLINGSDTNVLNDLQDRGLKLVLSTLPEF
ncbi:unnamed protein product [Didymodactylos carnosus]|uniref:Uncharacterized protein n=1 Tax=Didymodactylos carnosus TaxID=1234261 RepID=A0A816ACY3_9BILA|nr:unnamed protein product [Didymodactylos carnosus]CAF1594429.1 unnamed protein product [Didymodactylos carnosus]CAF3629534.1 unnamed protein product [Didymodactylos carnosus]CAF4468112.1 unnamed protein product [Didymodactylos carnosus]